VTPRCRRVGLPAAMLVLVLVLWPPAAGAAQQKQAGAAQHSDTGLSPRPPMGFNDWNAYGCHVSAALIESQARALHTSGLQADGYRYVIIDDCWPAAQRDAAGRLVADPVTFPGGIAAVARYVHRLGLKLGLYEDAGVSTCTRR
jgi:alpha-galactosidase